MPPLIRDAGLGSLGRHPTIATSSRMASTTDIDEEVSPSNDDLFGQLPEGKRRTFILVEDPQRGSRVRVKVGLDKVKMAEIPDSYRKDNAVYPRTYFPTQMKDAPLLVDPSKRFFAEDAEHTGDPEDSTIGRTTVPAPSMDSETGVDVPKLSRRRHRKEVMLNDLAYRLSWSQSRVFHGRMLFLQRSRKLTNFFMSSLFSPFDTLVPRIGMLYATLFLYGLRVCPRASNIVSLHSPVPRKGTSHLTPTVPTLTSP